MARILLVGGNIQGFERTVIPQVVRAGWRFDFIADVEEALDDLDNCTVEANYIAIAETTSDDDRQCIQNRAKAKNIPTTVINPLNQAQVTDLIAKLKEE